MNFIEELENMESLREKNLEKTENPDDRTMNKQDDTINLTFNELLQAKLESCKTIGELKELGEDVEDASNVLLEDLKKLLISFSISDDEMNNIISKACSLMGYEKVNTVGRSR